MNPAARIAVSGLAAVVAAAALAVPMIAEHEDVVLKSYPDPVQIPTACAGHTGPEVKLGQTFTLDQCMRILAADTVEHGLALDRCIARPVPNETRAAFTSFAFNVGARAACGSAAIRKLNAGDLKGACAELSRWTKVTVTGRAAARIAAGQAVARSAALWRPATLAEARAAKLDHRTATAMNAAEPGGALRIAVELPGLYTRRVRERAFCEKGLAS